MSEQLTGYRVSFAGLFGSRDGVSQTDSPTITEIEIPVVQRDYAQGRRLASVDDIRTAFLGALRDALEGGSSLSLDFVYGDVTDGVLRPLDGQQRLTTLYLLHWYLAQRAEVDLVAERWTRFSYATRHSSRRFLEELAAARLPSDLDTRISEWIVDQPWFHYGWEQDPTIRSMLVMLDAVDDTVGHLDAVESFGRLTSADAPAVSFYVLPIQEMGQGDTLYIKMNSRGKPLTPFENFKALFERAVAETPHGDEIAHKIDGVWSDVLWPFRGDDNIVDDEFLKYFTFLIEMGEWRADAPSEGRLIHRAERLFGGDNPSAAGALDHFVAALDTWVGVDTNEYFASLFRQPGPTDPDDLRPAVFLPEPLTGVNLFAMACEHYGEMRNHRARTFPLTLAVLLQAVIVHRLNASPDFLRRLRVLRNLVEASENEMRADRMHRILQDVETYLMSDDGDESLLSSLNSPQVEDEVRKREFLALNPGSQRAVRALEDHAILRGSLKGLGLEADRMEDRARGFYRMFQDKSSWPSLTGAFLTVGDYFRRPWDLSYYFGSPTAESRWRQLLTGGGKGLSSIHPAWAEMLDLVAEADGPLGSLYADLTESWLQGRRARGEYDWRYHLVAYPEMREGESGLYTTESGRLDFELCALRRLQLNSNYRDPYLSAIYRRSGAQDALQDPWFSGYQYHPRWLRITGSEIAVRCRNHGFDIACPGLESAVLDALQGLEGTVSAVEGHVVWWAPQRDNEDGEVTDAVDRVDIGSEIIRRLVRVAGLLTS